MRGGLLLGAALLAAALSVSCGAGRDFGAILSGNSRFNRGEYQSAAAAYLSVRDSGSRSQADFNLANVWSRLGERKAAEALYAKAIAEGGAPLKVSAWVNLGLLRYGSGEFEESWKAFREALRLDPGARDALRGLEIAFRAWQKEGASMPLGPAPAEVVEGGRGTEALRHLRRLETGSWRPGGQEAPSGSEKDY